jgi:phosphoadenosine phosphosulfate reductase
VTTVLQFSGGKDSLACLYKLKPQWDSIVVAWCNTGAAFPETVEFMSRIRQMVPHFFEIRGHQSIATEGYPADVVPTIRTAVGSVVTESSARRFQSRFSCCSSALWVPLHAAMKTLGATTIIRGQKDSDYLRSPVRHGEVVDGTRYEFPIRDWNDDDVRKFLAAEGVELPRSYGYINSSLDCWNCTAYLAENQGKPAYLQRFHPEKYKLVADVLRDLNRAINTETAPLKEIVHGL